MKKIFSLLFACVCASCMMMTATTYTVVGGSAAIFGETWAPANEANDMVAVEDVFQFVKEGVELPNGTIEYKIVEDHAWTKSYPQQGNASFQIAQAGKYDITFTLDLTKSPEYSVVAELKEEVDIDQTVSIKGAWDGWAEEVKFTLAEDKKSASAKKEFSANTYEFKVIVNGGDWRSNGGSFTRDEASADGIDGNNDANMNFVADVTGEYTFTWTFASNELVIAFPEKGDDPGDDPVDEPAVYTIAGTSALLGVNWDPTAAENDMVLDEETGIYTLVKENVVLSATNYEYKVVKDHQWGEGEFPTDGANMTLAIAEAGLYNVTFSFNPAIPELNAEAEKLGGDVEIEVKYYLVGSEKGWDPAEENLFVANLNQEGEFSIDATLIENESLKVVKTENGAITQWYPDGMGNDYVVDAAHAGEKTIYFRPAGNPEWVSFHEGGFFFIEANEEMAIDNTAVEGKAVKVLRNGHLLIVNGDKTYNALGIEIR